MKLHKFHVKLFIYLGFIVILFLISGHSFTQECVFTKNFSDTSLLVSWTGTLRVYRCTTCCKRWYFTFNGAECSGPLPIDGIVYLGAAGSQDPHRVRHIEGHCNNIHKGKVRVGFWVGQTAEMITMPTLAGNQCRGSMSKKSRKHKLRLRNRTFVFI